MGGSEEFFSRFLGEEEPDENNETPTTVEDDGGLPLLPRWPLIGCAVFFLLMVGALGVFGYLYSRTQVFLDAGFMGFAAQNGGVEKAANMVGADWLPAALWAHDNAALVAVAIIGVFGGAGALFTAVYGVYVRAYNKKIDALIEKELQD